METFNHKSNIEKSLSETVENLVIAKDLPIVFGHIVWGKMGEKGSLRISRNSVNQSLNDSLLKNGMKFRSHVRFFGRNKTFLDYLLLYWFEGQAIRTREISKDFVFGIKTQEEHIKEIDTSIILSKDFAKVLAPLELIKKYLDLLNGNLNVEENEYYLSALDACRYKALELIQNTDSYSTLESLSEKYKKIKSIPIRIINLLGALQSALVFIKSSFPTIENNIGFISKGTVLRYKASNENLIFSNPIILLSTPVKNIENIDFNVLDHATLTNVFHDFLTDPNLKASYNIPIQIRNKFSNNLLDTEKILALITNELKINETIEVKIFWCQHILFWNIVLIQYLRNSIHEGKALNFTFAIADVSEIEDSNLFEVVKLDFSQNNPFNIFHPFNTSITNNAAEFPKDSYPFLLNENQEFDFEKLLGSIRINIEKKNYSWFQDGKYALLWDATFPSKYPHSLIRIKNSSWEVLINEIRNKRGKDFLEKVSLSIIFLHQDQSGGMIIKDKLVTSFHRGSQWSLGQLERVDKVKAHISAAITFCEQNDRDELIKLMSEVIISISNDPHSGCILVISKISPGFENMGAPWRTLSNDKLKISEDDKPSINPLTLSKDELAALMGMDGATCIYFDEETMKPVIAFRNILRIDSNIFERTCESKELEGEGSRKWSSLNTARMKNIDLVIAVSQDGPIYNYIPNTDNKIIIDKL
jgi:hypothetical protein